MSEEALHIAEERCEAKAREKRKKRKAIPNWIQLQRIISRDKKTLLKWTVKEVEENRSRGKIQNGKHEITSRKRGIKRKFHARKGMIKDRKCKNLTETEDIKKRHGKNI